MPVPVPVAEREGIQVTRSVDPGARVPILVPYPAGLGTSFKDHVVQAKLLHDVNCCEPGDTHTDHHHAITLRGADLLSRGQLARRSGPTVKFLAEDRGLSGVD